MPHASLKVIPGVDQNRTPALNEAAISDCDLIRFVPDRQGVGLPQKLGGWQKFHPNAMPSMVRALHAWSDTNDTNHLAVGGEAGVDVITREPDGNKRLSLSPHVYEIDVPANITTVKDASKVLITDVGSNISDYDSVWIETHISVAGLILYGFYPTSASSTDQYSVIAKNVIGNPVKATASTPVDLFTGMAVTSGTWAGGQATITYPIGPDGFVFSAGTYIRITGSVGKYDGLHKITGSSTLPVGGPPTSGTITFNSATNIGALPAAGRVAYVPIAVFDGAAGNIAVTVTLADHGLQPNDTYPLMVDVQLESNLILPAGNYLVHSIVSNNAFSIISARAPKNDVTVVINNGLARYQYYIGQVAVSPPLGFGLGNFGVGGFGTGVSFTGGRKFNITSAVINADVMTLTYLTPVIDIGAGSQIKVTGVTPAEYNGTYTLTASTPTSVSYKVKKDATPPAGPGTVFGSFQVNAWDFDNTTDWTLDNWGGFLIASPHDGGIFYWSTEAGTNRVTVVPNAPFTSEGVFVAMPQRQIVAYGTTSNGIKDPLLIRWCDIGNYYVWSGKPTNQAGQYRIPKGSKIVGGIQGPQQGLIFTDVSVWAMQYINQPYVYSVNEIGTGCGLIGKKAVGSMGGIVYWMSQSQFYMVAGSSPTPIPCPIWDVIFQEIDMDYADHIRIAVNSRFNEVAWYYPIKLQPIQDPAFPDDPSKTIPDPLTGEPIRYVKYNALLQQWDFGTLARTAWIDQSIWGPPIGASVGRFLQQHETAADSGSAAMQSYFQTGYFTLSEGDLQTFVDQFWPDMKWGYYGDDQSARVDITFYVCDYPGQEPRVYGPFKFTQDSTFLTPRLRGRLVSIRVSSSDNPKDRGMFWRLGNVRYRYQPDGKF